MGNSTKQLPVLIIGLLIFIFPYHAKATGYQFDKMRTDTLTLYSPANPDCFQETTYKYDDSIADIGYTYGVSTRVQLGNYYPISDTCEGVIKSVDIYFSSNSMTSAQTCVINIYTPDYIILGSKLFVNTGSPWPAGTWVHVPFGAYIFYDGPFYAMVDYTITQTPEKNLMDVDTTTIQPGFPNGLGFVNVDGVWSPASVTLGGSKMVTFLERINGCGCPVTTGIKEFKPAPVSLSPNPAINFVNIVSSEDIQAIELLDIMGKTVYKTNENNLKDTKLDISDFPAGEYLVKITTISGIKTLKLTVIH
jgi:hypothetical protein